MKSTTLYSLLGKLIEDNKYLNECAEAHDVLEMFLIHHKLTLKTNIPQDFLLAVLEAFLHADRHVYADGYYNTWNWTFEMLIEGWKHDVEAN